MNNEAMEMPDCWVVVKDGQIIATHDEPAHIDGIQAVRYVPAPVQQEPVAAAKKDAVFSASIEFIGTLTGMKPPPIEVAPPEILKPFRDFTEKVCSIFATPQPAPVQQEPTVSKGAYNRLRDDYNDLVSRSEQDAKDAKQWRAHVNRCKLLGVDLDYQTTAPQPAQRKPLTDEQLKVLWANEEDLHWFRAVARIIEAAHGIKEQP